MRDVFIIGSKGIPASYGGFETFVDKLIENQVSKDVKYHVACFADESVPDEEFEYNGARCFNIKKRNLGAVDAVIYDLEAFRNVLNYIKSNDIQSPIVYVLACRIGPFIGNFVKELHELGGLLLVNPDGHEWLRAKWNKAIRRYWKESEALMVKWADVVVCDSVNIERYVLEEYCAFNPITIYVPYGADLTMSELTDEDAQWVKWLEHNSIVEKEYFLVVGRFVPENNYEFIIRNFMHAKTSKSLVLITDAKGSFFDDLNSKLHFADDPRIKFVGTVYDKELLKKIRENAYAYIHGHEVGGTNPSLLEGLSSSQLSLLIDVCFNKEVAQDSALYWQKNDLSLSDLIDEVEAYGDQELNEFDLRSSSQIENRYSWEKIVFSYETIFSLLPQELVAKKVSSAKEKRIGIDAHMLGDKSGGNETYYKNILRNMEFPEGYKAYLFVSSEGDFSEYEETFEVVRFKSSNPLIRYFIELPALCRKYDLDLIHTQYFLPPTLGCSTVCTIHDICFEHFEDIFPWLERLRQKRLISYAAKHADKVLTVSNDAKHDIMRTYGVPSKSIEVTYNAVAEGFRVLSDEELEQLDVRKKYEIGTEPYILSVGNLQPRKNLPRLIHAFNNYLEKNDVALKLVIVGKKAWQFDEIISEGNSSDAIVFTGYVQDEDLVALYNEAACFVYPSLYEGFGIPPLESMACGTPVAVSNVSSLPEVVGDAGLLFDPYSEDGIESAIFRLLNHKKLRDELVTRGLERVKAFSWRDSAKVVVKQYTAIIDND